MAPIICPDQEVSVIPKPSGFFGVAGGTTMFDTDFKDMNILQDKQAVIDILESLHYGTYVPEFYDCEDRAFWGAAHVRNAIPGYPIGVISGKAAYMQNQDHAIVMFFVKEDNKLKLVLYDPIKAHGEVKLNNQTGFHSVMSTVAFPICDKPVGQLFTGHPKYQLGDKSHKDFLIFDNKRLIYPLRKQNNGILDYLERGFRKCPDMDKHHKSETPADRITFKENWHDYDKALWYFVHVRRDYPGCPVGIGIISPDDVKGGSNSVLAIWNSGREKDVDGKLMPNPIYWDPETKKIRTKGTDIKFIFV